MKHSSYLLLLLVALVIALSACSGNRHKTRFAGQQAPGSEMLSPVESRSSTGVWSCAHYNDAATTATDDIWGMAQMVQEYMQGYVTGYIEGQGKNLPQNQANVDQIRRLLDTGCARAPNYTIQQVAESTSQLMYRQLQGIRPRKPTTPGTSGGVECSSYIEGKVSSDPAFVIVHQAAQNWVDGYVAAVLTSARRVFEPNTTKARVLQALDRTCSDNPRLTIQDAAEMVAKPLIATASRQRPGLRPLRPGQEEDALSSGGTVLE